MNNEIYEIIKDMKGYTPKNPIASSDINIYVSIKMAQLLVMLSEEIEKQNEKVLKYSKRIENFTKKLLIFTGVLTFIGIIQIVMMILNN